MTGFNIIQDPGGDDLANLSSPTQLKFFTGDPINGNATPFEIGTMTITNDGSGPGDVTLWSGDFLDASFNQGNDTVPQVLAVAAPEPSTLLLLGAGMVGLAVAVGARRSRIR